VFGVLQSANRLGEEPSLRQSPAPDELGGARTSLIQQAVLLSSCQASTCSPPSPSSLLWVSWSAAGWVSTASDKLHFVTWGSYGDENGSGCILVCSAMLIDVSEDLTSSIRGSALSSSETSVNMCQCAWWYISEDSHLHFMFDRQAIYLHESGPFGSIRGRTFRGQRVAVGSIMQRKTLLQWSDLTYAQDCLVSTESWVAVWS
jgi:hypothetical protein